ncbi:MAG: HAMP domain-containing protein [Pseudomonadota bacterium]|nr:HAMP domain-containing protein [Pseudomonadota bacterium]
MVRRGLFWQIYFTLLASLLFVAVLGAGLAHLMAERPLGAAIGARSHAMSAHGAHLLAMLLTVAATIGLVAYPVVSRITRRLETLRRSVEAWGAGNLTRRAPVEGRDEIAAVATSFNAAADRIEALLAAHKSLLAHASHELRTPLTRLGLAAEMLAKGAQPDSAALRREIAELDGLGACLDNPLDGWSEH